MNAFEIMSVVSCATSMVTMVAIFVAVLPRLKSGMVVIRDTVLWIVFVFVLTALIVIGFRRVVDQIQTKDKVSVAQPNAVVDNRYAGKLIP